MCCRPTASIYIIYQHCLGSDSDSSQCHGMTIIKESTTVIKNIKMIITLCCLSSAVRSPDPFKVYWLFTKYKTGETADPENLHSCSRGKCKHATGVIIKHQHSTFPSHLVPGTSKNSPGDGDTRRHILFVVRIMGDECWCRSCAVLSLVILMIFSFCPSCSMHSNEPVIIYQYHSQGRG